MKKKWRYIFLSFLLLLLCVGGYTFYLFKWKDYDIADPKLEKITEENFTITLPEGTELVMNSKGEIEKEQTISVVDGEKSVSTKKLTVADIKNKYRPTLKLLETLLSDKMNSLVEEARSEYQEKKVEGEKISYPYFYQKYIGAAEFLETNTDILFESVMSAVEKELHTIGYNPAYGESFREDYAQSKKSLRKGLYENLIKTI